MYPHHVKAIENLIAYFQPKEWVLTLVLGGSVAKGCARPDSDIDAMVVVTDEKYAQLAAANRTIETIEGYCDYPGGYFDVKYYNRAFIRAAAEKGSEPARNAFLKSRVLFTRDGESAAEVLKIPVFQASEKEEKLFSFYASYALSLYYFLPISGEDIFLRTKAAAEIVHFGLRMLLEEREVLFPCAKSMYLTVRRHFDDCEPLLQAADAFLSTRQEAEAKAFHAALFQRIAYRPPEDFGLVLSRFGKDIEQWWLGEPRPFVAEW